MSLRLFRIPANALFLAFGCVVASPAFAETIEDGYVYPVGHPLHGTTYVPKPPPVVAPPPVVRPPAPVVTTPPPVVAPSNPVPAPAPKPPAPSNVPTGPIFLGSETDLGQQPSLSNVFGRLNSQIDLYNNQAANDLPDAALSGAKLVVPTAPAPTTPPPVVQSQQTTTRPAGYFDPEAANRPAGYYDPETAPPPPVMVPPPAPTAPSITDITVDVTGWSFIVLKWGNVNHHFYIGDLSGSQNFRGVAPLSSYSFFQAQAIPIPDAGSTLILLTGALGALAYLRRRSRS